ncbi:MAG TPA: 16S rRNA (guanine(527)-N(7))-methyltransferase RsmG [Acidobacteriaceae bacterium]|jgi:16S rRNA (guanine527-N7)-methyltransferase|nr:16S rRNA (guanine(527)-N(7))-methyltransferase RsmG [Acidobacteriaceae bacterium]
MTPIPELEAHPSVAGLSSQQREQLETYLTLLMKWNARINLTAVRKPADIVQRHFSESLFAAQQIPSGVKTLLDYGSGAGLPGIPIAIAKPEVTVTLAESQNKKAAFLREAVRTLGLNAEVWAGRVEAMEAKRVFDAVTLRAVEKMAEACRTATERLGPEGWIAVFATRATEPASETIANIRWNRELAIPGSKQGLLKTGVRVYPE